MNVTQAALFPLDASRTTTITIAGAHHAQAGGNTTIALRVPFWATNDNSVSVNGESVATARLIPSSYVMLTRQWATGDEVVVHYPLSLRFEQLDDPRASFAGFGTFFYGPLLLAGLTRDQQLIVGNRTIDQVLARNSSSALSFEATPLATCGKPVPKVAMLPFNQLRNEHSSAQYQVYFHTQVFGRTTPTGSRDLQFRQASDFLLSGGASVLLNADAAEDAHDEIEEAERGTSGHDGHAGHAHVTSRALEDPNHLHFTVGGDGIDYDEETGNHYGIPASFRTTKLTVGSTSALNLRSGSPGGHSMAAMAAPYKGPGTITSITFSYRYVVGYGTAPDSTGAQLALVWLEDLDCPAAGNTTSLYQSPRYLEPSWDKCHECYSPPVNVSLTGLNLPAEQGAALAFKFDNGDHNLQLLLPITVEIGWV